jgi:hypothetical protein
MQLAFLDLPAYLMLILSEIYLSGSEMTIEISDAFRSSFTRDISHIPLAYSKLKIVKEADQHRFSVADISGPTFPTRCNAGASSSAGLIEQQLVVAAQSDRSFLPVILSVG